jgi:hypothetical protein
MRSGGRLGRRPRGLVGRYCRLLQILVCAMEESYSRANSNVSDYPETSKFVAITNASPNFLISAR